LSYLLFQILVPVTVINDVETKYGETTPQLVQKYPLIIKIKKGIIMKNHLIKVWLLMLISIASSNVFAGKTIYK